MKITCWKKDARLNFITIILLGKSFRLVKEGLVSLIASDMHSLERRPPNLGEAYEVIAKKFGVGVKNKLISNANEVLNACLKK